MIISQRQPGVRFDEYFYDHVTIVVAAFYSLEEPSGTQTVSCYDGMARIDEDAPLLVDYIGPQFRDE